MLGRDIVVITGMSGSGKSTAMRALEDAGWFCIDNLPVPLMNKVVDLGGGHQRLAFVIDAREGRFLKDAPGAVDEARRAGHRVEVLFLDASDDALTRRYSETRRRHPLDDGQGVASGLARERAALQPLRDAATHVLDTSALTMHELRRQLTTRFGTTHTGQLAVTVMSFGFKYGVPSNADLMLDVRFLPNPFFVPELKALTGRDERVAAHVLERAETQDFLALVLQLLEFLLPRYHKEGRAYLTLAIGCTGGKHRSVAIAARLVELLRQRPHGETAQVFDRDVDKE